MKLLSDRKKLTAAILVAVPLGMAAFAYFGAVPLYELFCRVTGYGGTTQVAGEASPIVVDRVIKVQFSADVAPGLSWRFAPVEKEIEIRPGETALAFYRAENLGGEPILGSATFNVTPQKAGIYFNKIECFCFSDQFLGPGEKAELAVTFFIDPEIADDRNMYDLDTVTLSYTFFDQGADARDAYLEDLKSAGSPAGATAIARTSDPNGHGAQMTHREDGIGGSDL
jgi:cytochrome c oxidase assembly protein subunit 11